MDYTAVGDTVNVAARLEGIAKAGEILVSKSAHSLLDAETTGVLMRSTKLRGQRQPISVYRLTAKWSCDLSGFMGRSAGFSLRMNCITSHQQLFTEGAHHLHEIPIP